MPAEPPRPSLNIRTPATATRMAPHKIHFDAIGTTLARDDNSTEVPLQQHRFRWTIYTDDGVTPVTGMTVDDPRTHSSSSSFDAATEQTGQSGAFIFETAGTYYIALEVRARYLDAAGSLQEFAVDESTNPDLSAHPAVVIVSIAADTRTDYFVKTGGNDGADGLSDGNAWATVGKVLANQANDRRFNFNKGDTFNHSSNMNWSSGTNQMIAAYGTGSRPAIIDNSGADSVSFFTGWSQNFIVRDVKLGTTHTEPTGGTHYEQLRMADSGASDALWWDCEIKGGDGTGFGRIFNFEGNRNMVFDCFANAIGNKCFGGTGLANLVAIGVVMGDHSAIEAANRLYRTGGGGTVCDGVGQDANGPVSIQACSFKGSLNDVFRFQSVDDTDVFRCAFHGKIQVGHDGGEVRRVFFDSCQYLPPPSGTINKQGNTRQNCKHVMHRACVWDSGGHPASVVIFLWGDIFSGTICEEAENSYTSREDIRFVNCTCRGAHPVKQKICISSGASFGGEQRWTGQIYANLLFTEWDNPDDATFVSVNSSDPSLVAVNHCYPDVGANGYGGGYFNGQSKVATQGSVSGVLFETVSTTAIRAETDYVPATSTVLEGGTARPETFHTYLGDEIAVTDTPAIGANGAVETDPNAIAGVFSVNTEFTGTLTDANADNISGSFDVQFDFDDATLIDGAAGSNDINGSWTNRVAIFHLFTVSSAPDPDSPSSSAGGLIIL